MSYRPIWGKPKLISDWGEEQEERETHWTSLFYDLIVVAAVGAISEPFLELKENDNDQEARRFLGETTESDNDDDYGLVGIQNIVLDAALKFGVILLQWNFLSDYTSRFEDESLAGHMAIFFHCFGMACSTAGVVGDLEENYVMLGRGLVLARLGLVVLHLRPLCYIPRARVHCMTRALQHFIAIGAILTFLWNVPAVINEIQDEEGDEEKEEDAKMGLTFFRYLLFALIVYDFFCVSSMVLLHEHRIPIHVSSLADRVKDAIMVIFGEAIFTVSLKPQINGGDWNYYISLFLCLWLIFSIALHEYHISPTPDDHALRRSVPAGTAWAFSSWFLQLFLLSSAIGIKRLYFLAHHNVPTVDQDTLHLLVAGMSLTLSVIFLMRFLSYWGRHPAPEDPPPLKKVKYLWWLLILLLVFAPYVLKYIVLGTDPSPKSCLWTFGSMMALIVWIEAILSNTVAAMTQKYCNTEDDTYIIRSFRQKNTINNKDKRKDYKSIDSKVNVDEEET